MGGSYLLCGFSVLLLASFLGEANAIKAKSESKHKVYIVYMGGLSSAKRSLHAQLQSHLMKRKKNPILHTYSRSFVGFAARLSDEEAESIAEEHGVVSVFPEKVLELHTTRSWDFLMSQNAASKTDHDSTLTTPPCQADIIIGILDSGISPDHPSFSDKDMGPIPQRWKGTCMPGKNSTHSFKCNRKVIGARYYAAGSITTPWDDTDGHGSHVASIAAGRRVLCGASYNGLAQGIPRGGSPKSRIAAYRICGAEAEGCRSSGTLKAFDDAIADGVDVLSLSLGGKHPDFFTNVVAIGAFHAMEKGITVVCSAGNDGPFPGTINNFAPWIVTVGATTIDRDFQADIVLGCGTKKITINAGGINFSGRNKSEVYPLVDGRSAGTNKHDVANARNCIPGTLDDDKVKGKIVLCESHDGEYDSTYKFDMLKSQGAIGMIMIDNYERQVAYTYETSPTSPVAIVAEGDGVLIRSYINSTSNPLVTILPTATVMNHKPAPVVAFFSARGPVLGTRNLLKPDIAAPGVDILGAWGVAIPGEKEPFFNIYSGTSMACPHVSGLVATVKSWHQKWSPSAIKSAIMTTAIQANNLHDPITTETGSRATPHDIGAGEINLFGPLCPGLVYETETIEYLQFLCNWGYDTSVVKTIGSTVPSNFSCPSNSNPDLISDMNYPSIAISGLKANGSRTVKRTVTNVGEEYSNYTASVEAPACMHIQVVPNKLYFTKNVKKQSFQVTFVGTTCFKGYWFGSLTWSNQKHKVRSPLVISVE